MDETPWGLPVADLDSAVEHAASDLELWRGARILVTGGTGFLGSWLVGTLLRADRILKLNLQLCLLTRRPSAVPLRHHHGLRLTEGDVREIPKLGTFDAIVHGAASSSAVPGDRDHDPRQIVDAIVSGAQQVLNLADQSGARVLFLSSGAVYGRQIVEAVKEDDPSGPNPLDHHSAYAEAKRVAETLCAATTASGAASVIVARLFTFVGPRLPLHIHYAAGNFLRDALANRPITVVGDGRAIRSYLYAGDLPEWCFALLARGRPGEAYNVGSPLPVSIADLADVAARLRDPPLSVSVKGKPNEQPIHRYVPSTAKAEHELNLTPRIGLRSAMKKTFWWASQHDSSP